jgi:hypothetical protein
MSRRIRNSRGRFTASAPIDVRSEKDIPKLEALIHKGPITFILVYADWCGHCQNYKPMWSKFEKTPGRVANIARVQETMFPKSSIKDAKIEGYPSVIKVTPTGEIEEYNVPGSRHPLTNAVPYMREEDTMMKELTTPSTNSRERESTGGIQGGIAGQFGGAMNRIAASVSKSIRSVFASSPKSSFKALTRAFIPTHHIRRTHRRRHFKSPKRSSHRASTRRNRRH